VTASRVRSWLGLALALAVAAATSCRGAEGADRPPAPGSSATPPVAPAIAVPIADAVPVTGPAIEPLRDHMKEHFAAVRVIQRAIVTARLEVARERARWIADHDEHSDLDGWKPHVDGMRAAARELAAATDLETAARFTAKLGRRCAACHEARTAVVAFPWEPEPENVPGLTAQMKRHEWAAERLWEGIVGPSDQLWRSGAETLFAARLDVDVAAKRGDATEVKAAAARLHALADEARRTNDTPERAKLYGDLLSTCAGCHALARDPAQGTTDPLPIDR